MGLNIAVVYGSVRESRQGIKAVKFVENKLKERGHEVTIIDPVTYELPLLNKMYKEYEKGQAPENLEKLATIFRGADCVVVVTAEYNHLPPPALLNLLDHFMEEYFFKPSAIVSYSAGSFGGVRAAVQIRDFLAEVGMPTIPSSFPIGKVQDSFDEHGKALDSGYDRRIKKFLDELEWYANALKEARSKSTPY